MSPVLTSPFVVPKDILWWRHQPEEEIVHLAASSIQDLLNANAGQNLQGLPGPVNVRGLGQLQFHSNADIQRLASQYNQANGLGQHPIDYARVDPQRGSQIAQEYEQMPHAPNDPRVRQAYDALKQESLAQYQHAINNGYHFEFYPPHYDPYPNSPREAVLDLHQNRHMYVYPTSSGFGSSEVADHPMLEDSGLRWNNQPVTYNDVFRAIHDVYGHAKEGLGFRHDGEDNAFRQHAAMFSPLAQQALTTETRGQNSWVNFGPYGQQNQTANQGETIYAPQKAGLMPEWTGNPNLHQPPVIARQSHILDEIHPTLPSRVWINPGSAEPQLKPEISDFIHSIIYNALETNGYHDPASWLNLVFTGSLTTYQYGPQSDADISLFVNADILPEWSRAEMIGIMVSSCDGHKIAGTYPLQCFVVSKTIHPGDLYRPGLRSGYNLETHHWIVPPDPHRSHNVQQRENGFYTYALEVADKLERLLKYEPAKAVQYFNSIRRRRREDQSLGKGDFSESNIVYKFLEKRGLTPQLEELSPSWVPRIKPASYNGWNVLSESTLQSPSREPAGQARRRRYPVARFSEVDVSAQPHRFTEAVGHALEGNPRAGYVASPEGLEGHRTFLGDNDRVGFTISPNGELGHLFRHPQGVPGTGRDAIEHGIANGAQWLNAFDGRLPEIYQEHGFTEQARLPWIDEFAPKDWDYEQHGRPDAVFMAHGVPENPGNYYNDWDDAEAATLQSLTQRTAATLDWLTEPTQPAYPTSRPPLPINVEDLGLFGQPHSMASEVAMQHTGQIPGDEQLTGELQFNRINPHSGINRSYIGQTGGREVYIKPEGLAHQDDMANERATFAAAHAMGLPMPHTVIRQVTVPPDLVSPDDTRNTVPAQVQHGIDGETILSNWEGRGGTMQLMYNLMQKHRQRVRDIALLDNVVGNQDRHFGNLILGNDGQLYPIDHGGAFQTVRSDSMDMGPLNGVFQGQQLTDDEANRLRNLAEMQYEEMGIPFEEAEAARDRARQMIETRKFLDTGQSMQFGASLTKVAWSPYSESATAALNHTGQIPGDEQFQQVAIDRENPHMGVNPSYIGTYQTPQGEQHEAYIKPEGEFHVNDLAHERAAFVTARALGINMPHTVIQEVNVPHTGGMTAIAQVQHSVGGQSAGSFYGYNRDAIEANHPEQFRNIALLDNVIANGDRHEGNMVVGNDGQLYPIDHGGAFRMRHGYGLTSGFFKGQLLSEDELNRLRAIQHMSFEDMGVSPNAANAARERMRMMIDSGEFLS